MSFQEYFIKAQTNLQERQQTSQQGGYHTGTENNVMDMSVEFSNLAQATLEDHAAVTNLKTANSTLIEQLAL